MERADEREQPRPEMDERLARLSEASLRINESLDFETVLQNVLDSARDLTGARYGVIATRDEQGGLEAYSEPQFSHRSQGFRPGRGCRPRSAKWNRRERRPPTRS